MWEREVEWLDPKNTRIVPLYTQGIFNEAMKEIEATADEGLNDPMPDAVTVEEALNQILTMVRK